VSIIFKPNFQHISNALKIPKLHEDICEYVEGNMDADRRIVFEKMLNKNVLVKSFVDDAIKGKKHLERYSLLNNPSDTGLKLH